MKLRCINFGLRLSLWPMITRVTWWPWWQWCALHAPLSMSSFLLVTERGNGYPYPPLSLSLQVGEHLSQGLCVSQVGEHKSLGICTHIIRYMCFQGGGTHITRDMCFPGGGTHITRAMCLPGGGTHITRDMCFPGGGTQITRDMYTYHWVYEFPWWRNTYY